MNKVLQFFKEDAANKAIVKNITVYGWQNEYDHLIITSLNKYLFEDLKLIENIVPVNETNRPYIIKPCKSSICNCN